MWVIREWRCTEHQFDMFWSLWAGYCGYKLDASIQQRAERCSVLTTREQICRKHQLDMGWCLWVGCCVRKKMHWNDTAESREMQCVDHQRAVRCNVLTIREQRDTMCWLSENTEMQCVVDHQKAEMHRAWICVSVSGLVVVLENKMHWYSREQRDAMCWPSETREMQCVEYQREERHSVLTIREAGYVLVSLGWLLC